MERNTFALAVTGNQDSGIQDNGPISCTFVSEVSIFVGNPVILYTDIYSLSENHKSRHNYLIFHNDYEIVFKCT